MSGKGGVGKTTITVNIAQALVKSNYSVGILDADIHGPNVLKLLGFQGLKMELREHTIIPFSVNNKLKIASISGFTDDDDAIIWRGPMKHNAIKQLSTDTDWGNIDYLLVDFPPGTGDEHISAAQIIKNVEGTILISTPQQVSLMDVSRSIDFCKKMNLNILGIIENMSGGIFGKETVKNICMKHNVPFLGYVPLCKEAVLSGEEGKYFLEYNNPELKKNFEDIIKNILKGEKN